VRQHAGEDENDENDRRGDGPTVKAGRNKKRTSEAMMGHELLPLNKRSR
jgi:hypothetical protein